jgi:hypothetical protein
MQGELPFVQAQPIEQMANNYRLRKVTYLVGDGDRCNSFLHY